jgi:hypothetical protein
MTYHNGNVYEGQWIKNKKYGNGIIHYINGEKHTCYYMKDKRYGTCLIEKVDGSIEEQEYKDDNLISNSTKHSIIELHKQIFCSNWFKFTNITFALNFASLNRDYRDNLKTIYIDELLIDNVYTLRRLCIFEEIYADRVIFGDGVKFYIRKLNLNKFFSKIKSCKELVLNQWFNKPIYDNELPESIKIVRILNHSYNEKICVFPKYVEELTVGKYFIQNKLIPSSVKKLMLYYYYDSEELRLGDIPNSVEDITFQNYNQPINQGVLPESIKIVRILDNDYNKVCFFPKYLEELTIGNYFIKNKLIPTSVKKLKLCDS